VLRIMGAGKPWEENPPMKTNPIITTGDDDGADGSEVEQVACSFVQIHGLARQPIMRKP